MLKELVYYAEKDAHYAQETCLMPMKCGHYAQEMFLLYSRNVPLILKKCISYTHECAYHAQEKCLHVCIMLKKNAKNGCIMHKKCAY